MTPKNIDDFEELLDSADTNAISEWDMEFVADIKDRYQKYGDDTFISQSQLEQLERVAGN